MCPVSKLEELQEQFDILKNLLGEMFPSSGGRYGPFLYAHQASRYGGRKYVFRNRTCTSLSEAVAYAREILDQGHD